MTSCVSCIIETTKGFLLQPTETFQQHIDTSLSKAFQYYTVLVIFYAILSGIIEGLLFSFGPYHEFSSFMHGGAIFGLALGTFVLFLIFIIIPSSLIGIFFSGAFQHIFVLLFGGEGGIAQTLKAMMYSAVPVLVLGWIPIVNIIAAIWSVVLLILGIRELHQISTERSIATVLIPIIFAFLFAILLILLIVMSIAAVGVGIAEAMTYF